MDNFTGYDILNLADRDNEELSRTAEPIAFASSGEEVNEIIDPRPFLRVENQGRYSSCTGNAASTGMEMLWGCQAGDFSVVKQLSRWWAYIQAQKLFGNVGRDAGASIAAMVKAMSETGCCLEETCPYPQNGYTTKLPNAAAEAALHRIGSHTMCEAWEQATSYIRGIGFLDWGIIWTGALANLRSKYIRLSTVTEDGSRSGHSISGVGVVKEGGEEFIITANSHSENWAENGYGLMDRKAFEYLIKRRYTVAILCSDLSGAERVHRKLESFSNW
jgi:Papain family cysteine protease